MPTEQQRLDGDRATRETTDISPYLPLKIVSSADGKDTVFRALLGGRTVGEMRVEMLPLVHDLDIQPGMLQRRVAEALFQYASGYVKASGFTEAYVLVGLNNEPMRRWVGERADAEEPCELFIMGVS